MKELITMNCLVFLVVGLLGVIAHAVKKWTADNVHPMEWFLSDARTTVASAMGCFAAVLAGIASHTFTDYNQLVQIIAAFTACYTIDSGVNRA